MESNLKEKTARGIKWGFIDNVAGVGIIAIANLILARILSPQDFGIIGMTAIFITLSNSLIDSGFSSALIRLKSVTEKDLNTVFHFNFLTSLFLYAILYFTAPLIAGFFSQPVLTDIVRVLSLSMIVNALCIVQKVILIRRIDFRTQAIASTVSSVLSSGVAIWMALYGFGVWSLVALQVLKSVFTAVILWLCSKWFPSFLFSVKSLKEMFSFGGRMLLTAIVSTLWSEIYSFIIGKTYAPSVLGQYSRADKFRNMVTSNISTVMQRVTYPVLSMINDEKDRQARAYRKILRTAVLIMFPAVLGLAAVSEPLVLTLIGDQWVPAVGYLRILCLSGLFTPLMFCSVSILNADGRSDLTLYLEIFKTAMAVFPVLAGIFFSIEALLWTAVAASAVSYLAYAAAVSRIAGYSVWRQLKDVAPFFAVSAVLSVANIFIRSIILQCVVYALMLYAIFRVFSFMACFIFSMVSRRGLTIWPRLVLLDSANSFWRCFSMSSVADFTWAETLAIISSKRACCAASASACRFSCAASASLHAVSLALRASWQASSLAAKAAWEVFSFSCNACRA